MGCVISGDCVFVDNIPRRRVVEVGLSVFRRRSDRFDGTDRWVCGGDSDGGDSDGDGGGGDVMCLCNTSTVEWKQWLSDYENQYNLRYFPPAII